MAQEGGGGIFVQIRGQVAKSLLEGLQNLRNELKNLAQTAKETGSKELGEGLERASESFQKTIDDLSGSIEDVKEKKEEFNETLSDLGEAEEPRHIQIYSQALEKLEKDLGGYIETNKEAQRRASELADAVARTARHLEETETFDKSGRDAQKWADTIDYAALKAEYLKGNIKKTSDGLVPLTKKAREALQMNEDLAETMTKNIGVLRRYNETQRKLKERIAGGDKEAKKMASTLQHLGQRFGFSNEIIDVSRKKVEALEKAIAELSNTAKSLSPEELKEFGTTREELDKAIDGIRRTKTVLEEYRGNLKVTNKTIKIFNEQGLKAIPGLSKDAARALGVLDESFDTQKVDNFIKRIEELLGVNFEKFNFDEIGLKQHKEDLQAARREMNKYKESLEERGAYEKTRRAIDENVEALKKRIKALREGEKEEEKLADQTRATGQDLEANDVIAENYQKQLAELIKEFHRLQGVSEEGIKWLSRVNFREHGEDIQFLSSQLRKHRDALENFGVYKELRDGLQKLRVEYEDYIKALRKGEKEEEKLANQTRATGQDLEANDAIAENYQKQLAELIKEFHRLQGVSEEGLEGLSRVEFRKYGEDVQFFNSQLKKNRDALENYGVYEELRDGLQKLRMEYEDYNKELNKRIREGKKEIQRNEKLDETYEFIQESLDKLAEKQVSTFDSEELRKYNTDLSELESYLRNIRGLMPEEEFEKFRERISDLRRATTRFRTTWERAIEDLPGPEKEAMEALGDQFGKTTENAQDFRKAIREINKFDQERMNQIVEHINHLKNQTKQTERTREKINELENEYESLSKKQGFADKATKRFKESLGGISSKYSQFNKASRISIAQMGALGNVMSHVNARIRQFGTFVLAAMVIQGLAQAVQEFVQIISQFNQALYNLQAILEVTSSQARVLGETIKDVSRTTKFSAAEVAEGMQTLGQAGLSMQESMMAVKGVAQLATGTITQFGITADLITSTLNAFSLAATESTRTADIFANAINNSKLTIDKLSTAFNYVGAAGKQAGLTLNELTGTLMTLADNGIRASTMGTGLRRMMLKMIDPADELVAQLKRFGMTVDDLNPKMVGWEQALRNLTPILWDTERQTVDMGRAVEYFGTRAAQVAAVVVRSVSDESRALEKATQKTFEFGSAAEMAEKQEKGMSLMLKNLADRARLVAVALGETGLTQILKDLIGALKGAVTKVESFINNYGKLAELIGTAGVIGTLGLAFGGLSPIVAKLNYKLGVFIARYSSMIAKVGIWTAGLTAVAFAVNKLAGYHYDAAKAATDHARKLSSLGNTAQAWGKSLVDAYGTRAWTSTVKRFKKQNEEMAESIEEDLGFAIEYIAGPEGLEQLQKAFETFSIQKFNEQTKEAISGLNSASSALKQYISIMGEELPEAHDKVHKGFDQLNKSTSDLYSVFYDLAGRQGIIGGYISSLRAMYDFFGPDKEKLLSQYKDSLDAMAQGIANLAEQQDWSLTALRGQVQQTVEQIKNELGEGSKAVEAIQFFKAEMTHFQFDPAIGQLAGIQAHLRGVQQEFSQGAITVKDARKKLEGYGIELEDLTSVNKNLIEVRKWLLNQLVKVISGEKSLTDVTDELRKKTSLSEKAINRVINALEGNREALSSVKEESKETAKSLDMVEQSYNEINQMLDRSVEFRKAKINNFYEWKRFMLEKDIGNERMLNQELVRLEERRKDELIQLAREQARAKTGTVQAELEETRSYYRENAEDIENIEENITEAVREADEEISEIQQNSIDARVEAYQNYESSLMRVYENLEEREREYVEQIRESKEEIKEIREEEKNSLRNMKDMANEAIREIKRAGMTEVEVQKDRINEAEKMMRRADKLISEGTQESYERAKSLMRDYIGIWRDLGSTAAQAAQENQEAFRELAEEKGVLERTARLNQEYRKQVDIQESIASKSEALNKIQRAKKKLINLVTKATEQQIESEQDSIEKAEEGKEKIEATQESILEKIKKVKDKMVELKELKFEKKKLDVDKTSLDKAIDAAAQLRNELSSIDGMDVDYTVNKHTSTTKSGGGSETDIGGIPGLDKDYPAGYFMNYQTGGFVPGGYGGGDRVGVQAEPGEFIVRKEAVRKYGEGLMNMINNMNFSASNMMNRMRKSMNGGSWKAGREETLVVRFQSDDMEAPVRITDPSSRAAMKSFTRELEKKRMSYAR